MAFCFLSVQVCIFLCIDFWIVLLRAVHYPYFFCFCFLVLVSVLFFWGRGICVVCVVLFCFVLFCFVLFSFHC